MPKHPEQKAAFLTFPKCGENIFHGQVTGDMRLGIGIFVHLIDHNIEQHTYNSKGAEAMNDEAITT